MIPTMPMTPLASGTVLAALAALAFGLTTPFIQRFGTGLGPFTTAAWLYLGAILGAIGRPHRGTERREASLRLRHFPRLLAIAFFGAALAPALFAWGLQRVSATYGSLLLNGEAVFTVGLAALLHHEHVGRRVALAVVAAVFSWALDNVLTRPFADLDPAAVVRVKALGGVLLTGALAFSCGEPRPGWTPIIGLLACGATGYGVSLRLYLLAQRRIGAGRTGSVFAVAPFVGAELALVLGDKPAGVTTAVAAVLFIAGLALHLTERHGHEHVHAALAHDHAHSHDDGHHAHRHDVPPVGPHSHPHRHDATAHAHPHGPDVHHVHEH